MKYIISSILPFVLFITVVQAQKSYTLKFNPANGDKYNVETTTKTQMSQNVMGQDVNINMNYDVEMTYAITDTNANKKLTMTYERLKLNMDAMGQMQTMDTEDSSSNEVSNALKSVKGKTVSVTLSPTGKVLQVEGTREIIDNIGGDAQKEILKAIFSEDALKSMMEQSFNYYPEKPVKVGDSWTSTITLKSPYPIVAENTYKLNKVEGNDAFIDIISKVKTEEGAKMSYSGVELTVELTGDIKGNNQVNLQTGMPVNSTSKQNLKGNITTQGMTIPMSVNSDTIIKFSKK